MGYAFLLVSLAVQLRAILDFDIIDYKTLILYSLLFAAVISFLLLSVWKIQFNKKHTSAIIMNSLLVMLYTFGTIALINCYYDTADPEVYTVKIVDKSISHSRRYGTSHNLIMEPWGPISSEKWVKVPPSLYDRLEIGDTVTLKLKKGLFNIRWYYFSD